MHQGLLQASGRFSHLGESRGQSQHHSSGLSLISLQMNIPHVLFTPVQVSSLMEYYFLAAALGWSPASIWQSHVYMAYGRGADVNPPM